jgi:hypothetical protein
MINQQVSDHKKKLLFSAIFIIISNLVAIALFNIQNWDFFTIIWIFCFQFLVIGFFKLILVLSSEGDASSKFFVGYFLICAYSIFFFLFITSLWNKPPNIDFFNWLLILGAFFVFFINHTISFLRHKNQVIVFGEVLRKHILFRIGPIWIFLIIAGGIEKYVNEGNMILLNGFLFLKIIMDVVTHIFENINPPKYKEKTAKKRTPDKEKRSYLIGAVLLIFTFWIWVLGGLFSLRYSNICIPSLILGIIFLIVSIIYNVRKKTISIQKER